MFLYLSSEDSKELYPFNTATDFTVELPKVVTGTHLSLHHIHYSKRDQTPKVYYYILCDLVEASVVGGKEEQVLGAFYQRGDLLSPKPLVLTTQAFKRIRFRILKRDLTVPEDLLSVNLTLQLS